MPSAFISKIMSKNILIISASPRRGGNSDILCDQFALGAAQAGHQVEKVFVRDKKINYCCGCYTCLKTKGVCIYKDDMPELLQKIIDADVLVLASPVYFNTINAQLKTVIDRMMARYPEVANKDAYMIATAMDHDMAAFDGTIDVFNSFLRSRPTLRKGGMIFANKVDEIGEVRNHPAMQKAYEAGLSA